MVQNLRKDRTYLLGALLVLLTLLLAACGSDMEEISAPASTAPTVAVDAPAPTAVQAQPTVAPAAVATESPVAAPTEAPVQEAAPTSAPVEEAAAPADWSETVTVEGDYYVRGNPAAPIRLIDYSDFL